MSSLLVVTGLRAADDQGFERVLIPIRIVEPVPGAHGSLWVSSLLVRNIGSTWLMLHGVSNECGGILCPPSAIVFPDETLTVSPSGNFDRPAALLHIHAPRADDVTYSLRVQDVSRQRLTWGTEIPVVRESGLFNEMITLVGIPVSTDFRTTLRIYNVAEGPDQSVRLRIFGLRPGDLFAAPRVADELLGEAVIALRPPPSSDAGRSPAYFETGDLAQFIRPHNYDLLAIEIEPVSENMLLWAFAAIVNNETQHLTILSPQ